MNNLLITPPLHPDKFRYPVSGEMYQKQLKAYELYHAPKPETVKRKPSAFEIPGFVQYPKNCVARKLINGLGV